MPRSVGTSVENNFVNGFITEASGLQFPENAVTDCDNVVFEDTGKVVRRKGFTLEPSAVFSSALDAANQAQTLYLWENAANNGDISIVVQQLGSTLYFWRVAANAPLSSGFVGALTIANTTGAFYPFQYTVGMGYLVVSNPKMDPCVIQFDQVNNTVSVLTHVILRVRDFQYLDDEAGQKRPKNTEGVSNKYRYNLLNAGWPMNYINQFKSDMGFWPGAFGDVWWTMLRPYTPPSELLKKIPASAFPLEEFSPKTTFAGVAYNPSPSPRGHYIYSPFNVNRGARVKLSGIPSSLTAERPSSVEFFSGRIFYAGVNAPEYNNQIWFSQVLDAEGTNKWGKCYQQNDPTNREAADLLSTDGGVVRIPDAGSIVKLFAMDGNLLVFATNGIWAISGSVGSGFTATDYSIKKVSSVGAISAYSFVDASGTPIWWNYDGIFTLQSNQTLGATQVVSLVDKKIKRFYIDEINNLSKLYARGYFNSITREIIWLYRSTTTTSVELNQQFDSLLVFNTITGAFYKHSYTGTNYRLHGVIAVKGVTLDEEITAVTTRQGEILVNNGEEVEGRVLTRHELSNTFKFLVSNTSGQFTFADMSDETFKDFGVDYSSWFVSGYKLRGDGNRKAQVPYLNIYADTNDDNLTKVYFQSIWDFATTRDSGRWSSRQRLEWDNAARTHDSKRIKLRGSGKACQFKFTSVPGEPFFIVGWVATDSVNGSP